MSRVLSVAPVDWSIRINVAQVVVVEQVNRRSPAPVPVMVATAGVCTKDTRAGPDTP
jgi:hypothetical protein